MRTTSDFKSSLLLWNARSIQDITEFNKFTGLIALYKSGFDFLIIGETWISKDCVRKLNPYSIKNYSSIHSSREHRTGGGLAMYVRNTIKFTTEENRAEPFHKIKLTIKIDGKWSKVIGYYRPPDQDNINEFLLDIESELDTEVPTIIAGDLNINILKNDYVCKRYMDIIISMGAQIINSCVTRDSSQSLIDHLIVKNFPLFSDIATIQTSLSDHSFVVATAPIFSSHKSILTRKFTNYDVVRDNFKLNRDFYTTNDTSKLIEMLVNDIREAVGIGTIERTFNLKRRVDALPWFNFRILEQMKQVENISHKINKLKKMRLPFNNLSCKLNEKKVHLKRLIGVKCASHYNQLFKGCDIKRTWSNINDILGKHEIQKNITLEVNQVLNDDEAVVAEEFSLYFNSINNNNQFNLENLKIHNNNNNSTIFLHPTDRWEVMDVINKLPNKLTIGPDGISMKSIKELCIELAPAIAHLINSIIETAVYPSSLKRAIVTPIFKSGNANLPSSYRPIGITDNLSKITEKIIFNRIEEFTNIHGYTDRNQFGFQKHRGTELALTHLFYYILNNVDKGSIVIVIFLDVSKAFNSLPHLSICEKLEKYGVRGKASKLIESYLDERYEAIKINDQLSVYRKNASGVQQGSIAGPYLFNITVDDLKGIKTKSTIHRFADDICICLPCTKNNFENDVEQLKRDVNEIINYHTMNGLSINTNKSKAMAFGSSSVVSLVPSEIRIGAETINFVNQHKHLGCLLDNSLKMNEHVDYIIAKINPVVGVMSKLRYLLPQHSLLHIYFAHVHSHLMYAISIYGHASSYHINRLQSLQNRAVKLIYKLNSRHPTIELYTKINKNVLPVLGLLFYSTVMQVHKIKMGLVDVDIPLEINDRPSRQNGTLMTTKFRTNNGRRSISYFGFTLYNRLPNDLKAQTNLQTFKSQLKKYLLCKIESILNCSNSFHLLNL
jgi:hypothetical protein